MSEWHLLNLLRMVILKVGVWGILLHSQQYHTVIVTVMYVGRLKILWYIQTA